MNTYTLRQIVKFIQDQGRLPTDPYGQTLCPQDVLAFYGLNTLLHPDEQRLLRREIVALAEAEAIMDQLRSHGE
jgi:hypothetical protein